MQVMIKTLPLVAMFFLMASCSGGQAPTSGSSSLASLSISEPAMTDGSQMAFDSAGVSLTALNKDTKQPSGDVKDYTLAGKASTNDAIKVTPGLYKIAVSYFVAGAADAILSSEFCSADLQNAKAVTLLAGVLNKVDINLCKKSGGTTPDATVTATNDPATATADVAINPTIIDGSSPATDLPQPTPAPAAPAAGSSEAAIAQLLADCGADAAMFEDSVASRVLLEKTLNAVPFTKTKTVTVVIPVTATATLAATLYVKATGANTVESINITPKSISPSIASSIGMPMAQQEAAANSGTVTFTNVLFKDFLTLGQKYAQYDGMLCTLLPATQVVNKTGGKTTTATFDTPVPAAISPLAVLSRHEAELGAGKVFDNLTATIVSSDNPVLSGKATVTGSVTIEKVSPSSSFGPAGDIAYRVTTNFESPAVTYALGMIPVVTYYIQTTSKSLVGVIADMSSISNPVVSFK